MEWPNITFPPINLWSIPMIDSRKKGADYERKIAKIISEAIGFTFKRTPGSGAFGTINEMQSLQGDLVCTDNDNWDWFFELKKYEKVNLYHFAQRAKSCNITKWLEKMEEQKADQHGCLIFAENRGKNMCLVERDVEYLLGTSGNVVFYMTDNCVYQLMLLEEWLKEF